MQWSLAILLVAGCCSSEEVLPLPSKIKVGPLSPEDHFVTAPSWATPDDRAKVARCVDEYIVEFGLLAGARVPSGMVIEVVDGTVAVEGYSFTGYFWLSPMWVGAGGLWVPLRYIRVVWEREFLSSKPRSENPLDILPHELVHDLQGREGRKIDHNFTTRDNALASIHEVECQLEGRP
jgi:hypothetical protein